MYPSSKAAFKVIRSGVLIAVLSVMLTATAVYATLYSIGTDDNTVEDWSEINVFQLDDPNDMSGIGGTGDDMIMTKVASGQEPDGKLYLYFLMQTEAAPALPDITDAAVAIIDCDRDGIENEPTDRRVVYFPELDSVYVQYGDSSYYATVPDGAPATGDPTFGQRVDNYVEWKIPLDNLPPDDGSEQTVDCHNNVNIRFKTELLVIGLGSFGQLIDQTNSSTGWNIPTAITLSELGVSERNQAVGILFLAIVATTLLSGLVVVLVGKTKNPFRNLL